LRAVLAAGATRAVVGLNRTGKRAVPTNDDTSFAEALLAASVVVGVSLVDIVILGDDGFCSLLRLGVLPADCNDSRYR